MLVIAAVVTITLVSDRDVGDGTRDGPQDEVGIAGPRVEGDRYAFGLPPGWTDQPSARGLFSTRGDAQALHVLSSSPDPRELSRNGYVTVVRAAGGAAPIDLGRSVSEFVRGARSTGVDARLRGTPRRVDLAGEEAVAFEFVISSRGLRLRGRGVNAVHDGALYSVALTVAERAYPRAVPKLRHVTSTWRWR
ncbi:MAG TPA: hypothetical protein VKG45_07875 [Actinomycetes bacterium]|nr:hypothetical protein [Actinomycetes bacterium]